MLEALEEAEPKPEPEPEPEPEGGEGSPVAGAAVRGAAAGAIADGMDPAEEGGSSCLAQGQGGGDANASADASASANATQKIKPSSIFSGSLQATTKCYECESESARQEPFQVMSLCSEPGRSLTTSLGDHLSEDS